MEKNQYKFFESDIKIKDNVINYLYHINRENNLFKQNNIFNTILYCSNIFG